MVERRLIALLLSGFFLMSVLPFSPSVSFNPLQMGDDDEGQVLSEQQIVALESLPASDKVSGRTGNSTMETVQWAAKAGGPKGDVAFAIGVDLSGNAYVTGRFSNTAVFGSTSLTSSGDIDIFIAKLNRSGSWQWAVRAGGSGYSDVGTAIAVDSSGNAYVTGTFGNTAIFGTTSLTSSGQSDIFIAKLSTSGLWQWAVKAGGSSEDGNIGNGITIDSNGNVYVSGDFQETATFGSTSLTSNGASGIFIAKLSNSGSWQWAVTADDANSDIERAYGIAVDSSGNIYVTGYFSDTAIFGNTSLTSDGPSDIFIAKLSTSGLWQWAVKAGSSGRDDGRGIAVDSNGDTYVTGTFENTAVFGSTTLTSNGLLDPFIAKLNSSGSWQWAVQAGGSENDLGWSIAVDSSGNVYAAGTFQDNASFGNTNLTSNGRMDSFIAKLNSSGSWQSAVKAGSSQRDFLAFTIAVDSSDNAYLAGSFVKTATVGSSNLSSIGGGDEIFVYANIADRDLDGIKNPIDACSNGATDWKSSTSTDYDSDGCRDFDEDIDDDDDSVMDSIDFCPKGDLGWTSDSSTDYDGDGCQDAVEDIDDDNDGISDVTEIDTGSNPLDPDSDADGYQDGEDVFPTDTTEWSDSDGDGVGDNSDAFPYDPEEWSDSDLDEVGDNSDACPDVFGTSLHPLPGCPDSDSDGWADSDDVFPNDESEWIDSDADGVGDNADSCPLEFGTSTQIERYGCPENNELDANETLDSDGDGVEDNSDNCPGTTNNTVVDLEGCIITTKSTSDTASNFFSDSRTWTAIIVLFVAIIGAAVKVRSGGRGKEKEEESVVQQASTQTNPTMNSLSKPSAQVMANNGIESGYELLQHEGNNYYRVPGSWSEWTQYQR